MRHISELQIEQMCQSAEEFLGPKVRALGCKLDGPAHTLLGQENTLVIKAVEKRIKEFSAGRHLARDLMKILDIPVVPLMRNDDRSPKWPDTMTGTITHTNEVCLVAAGRLAAHSTIGLDLEGAEPLSEDLLKFIVREDEFDQLPPGEIRHFAKLIFSAKEAFYKAQHFHTKAMLDFLEVSLKLNTDKKTFQVLVHHPVGTKLPAQIHGSWRYIGDFVLTGVRIDR